MRTVYFLLGTAFLIGTFITDQANHPELSISVFIDAEVEQVWDYFSDSEGLESWFSPGISMQPVEGGDFVVSQTLPTLYRDPITSRQKVLAIEPGELLSFSWPLLPEFHDVTDLLTTVEISLKEWEKGQTWVTLRQDGFRSGQPSEISMDYYRDMWQVSLARLKYVCEGGSLDWFEPWSPEGP